MNTELAKHIRIGRAKKNISQKELAQKLNVVPSAVSQWESGKKIPGGDVLIKLAIFLDIIPDVFPGYHKDEIIEVHKDEENKYVTINEFKKEIAELKKSIVISQNNHRCDNVMNHVNVGKE